MDVPLGVYENEIWTSFKKKLGPSFSQVVSTFCS